MANTPKGKRSISITLDDDLIEKVKKDAELDMRNVSSQIAYILTRYFTDKNDNNNYA